MGWIGLPLLAGLGLLRRRRRAATDSPSRPS
jgi:hypothetical protein